MTKERVKALLFGLTVASILVNGRLESNMAWVLISVKMVSRSKASGKMAAKFVGLETMLARMIFRTTDISLNKKIITL